MRFRHILIADDNSLFRQILHETLETHARWKVCGEASDGWDAVELARQLHPDIIVLDQQMRWMHGLEVAPLIATFAPNTPILLLTADDSHELRDRAVSAGIREVIQKDCARDRLISCIESLLAHRSPARSGHSHQVSRRAVLPSMKRHVVGDHTVTRRRAA
jgi:DNA-binding NarL/FixJ family response regulator